jgi:hypothetical protein
MLINIDKELSTTQREEKHRQWNHYRTVSLRVLRQIRLAVKWRRLIYYFCSIITPFAVTRLSKEKELSSEVLPRARK